MLLGVHLTASFLSSRHTTGVLKDKIIYQTGIEEYLNQYKYKQLNELHHNYSFDFPKNWAISNMMG